MAKSPTELTAEIIAADISGKNFSNEDLVKRYEAIFNKILECRRKETSSFPAEAVGSVESLDL